MLRLVALREDSAYAGQAVLEGALDIAPEPEGADEFHLDEAGGPSRHQARGFKRLLFTHEFP